MKNNDKTKICPLMSNADKIVYCTNNCALYSTELFSDKCTLLQLTEAIQELNMNVQTIDYSSKE